VGVEQSTSEPAPAGEARTSAGAGPADGPWSRALAELERLEGQADSLRAGARSLRPFAKAETFADLGKLERALAKLDADLSAERRAALGLDSLVAELTEHPARARVELRKRLGQELKAACERLKLGFHLVSRENPIEVRIPPLAMRLDIERGSAELCFARVPVVTCAASTEQILVAHRKAVEKLERAFAPDEFLEDCWRAYRMTLADQGKQPGDRVEILSFLPALALSLQPKKFQLDPVATNFQSYSRAQFAYDVHRLRKAGKLAAKGKRINFGVATGTSASNKKRVLYLEDELGRGEYKLTVFFSEE